MDTLSFHKQRPLLSAMDLTGASLQYVMGEYDTAKAMLLKYEGAVKAKPEAEALWFYVQNHIMCLIGKAVDNDEPLRDYQHFVNMYHIDINRKMIRMFYYLLLICSRESRHMSAGPGRNNLWKKYPNIYDYHSNHVQDSSEVSAVNALIENAPDITLGEYTQFLVDAFQFPAYVKGYGGKNWKKVAEPLRDFVHGKITAEVLMDTGFTLAHNNGPIFNKGMLYEGFNGHRLNKILDIQRSGQIPQAILHSEDVKSVDSQMTEYVQSFMRVSKESFGHIDWKKVRNINGHAVYSVEMSHQKAVKGAGGTITGMKEKVEIMQVAKAKTDSDALLAASVEILPGVYVAKSERSL